MKGERKGIRKLIFPMEQVAGIEPAPSAWKADILAVIRYLHNFAMFLMNRPSVSGSPTNGT